MKPEKEKASAVTLAMRNKLHNRSYPKAVTPSSPKELIGLVLLNLQGKQQPEWQVFELILRCYIDLKYCEVQL